MARCLLFLVLAGVLSACVAPEDSLPEKYRQSLQAAEQGDTEAQFKLGLMYATGDVQAVYWFTKAAEQGDPRAQFNLGVSYESGEGVPEDDIQAV